MTKKEFHSKFTSCYENQLKPLTDVEEIYKRLSLNDSENLSSNEIIAKLFYMNLEISTKFLYEFLYQVLEFDD